MLRQLLGFSAIVWVASGCDDHIVGEGIPITSSCLRRPPLNYVNTGEGLIERHCRSCHGRFQIGPQRSQAPEGIDFDDEADVLFFAQDIYRTSVVDQTMPPAGGMLEHERQLMDEWLRCDVLPRAGRLELE